MSNDTAAIERARRRVARLRRQGRPLCGKPPLGSKLAGPRGRRVLHPDLKAREAMARIVEIRDSQAPPLSFNLVSDQLEAELAAQENREPIHRWHRRRWGPSRCWRAYTAELELQAQEAAANQPRANQTD